MSLSNEALGLVATLGWDVHKGPKQSEVPPDEEEEAQETNSFDEVRKETEGRRSNLLSSSSNVRQYKRENIKDGDYVYAPDKLMEGVYFKGGIIIDFK